MIQFLNQGILGGIRVVLGCRAQTIGCRKPLGINLRLRSKIRVIEIIKLHRITIFP
jgi:hypothetical protein